MPEAIRTHGRRIYLQALQEHWPEMLDSLRRDLAPLFRPRWKNLEDGTSVLIVEDWDDISNDPQRSAVRDGVRQWAQHFGIKDTWLLDAAVHTLSFYLSEKRSVQRWVWRYVPGFQGISFQPKFDEIWSPLGVETWEQFRNRMHAQVTRQLSRYRKERIKHSSLAEQDTERDAEWTVRYQRGSLATEIAVELRAYRDPEQVVYRAISRFAQSIGLTLRKKKRRSVPPSC